MTQRFSISLPDDVARRLGEEENASAFIAEAIRLRMRRESLAQVIAGAGYTVTDDGKERMRSLLHAAEASRSTRHAAAA